MSSPAQGGPSVPRDKEKSMGSRMLTRMKTIVKRAERRISISGRSRAGGPSTEPAEATTEAAATNESAPAEPSDQAAVDAPTYTKVPKMQLHEERARKLGERFGLEIKPSEWHTTAGDALRVEKPIRMRVHHTCHTCKTNFGAAKICPSCQHKRCKECPRYPPRRTEAEKVASRERRAALLKERQENPPILADWDLTEKPVVLRRPAKSGGQDLIYKKPRQRVRRNCCQCEKLFARKTKTCADCGHKRCTDCSRDPAKPAYYPYGYPGDEFGVKSTPHHECHECKTKFPANSADGSVCSNCSHPKCSNCQRLKPRRVEPEPDPDVLRSVEARIAALRVG